MKHVRKLLEQVSLKFILLAIWILMTLFYGLQVTVNNMNASSGKTLNNMYIQIAQLQLSNQILENEIASRSSLLYIEAKAKEMGFVQAKKIQYIK